MTEFAKVFEQAANESLEKWNPEIDCLGLSSSGMNHFEILFPFTPSIIAVAHAPER